MSPNFQWFHCKQITVVSLHFHCTFPAKICSVTAMGFITYIQLRKMNVIRLAVYSVKWPFSQGCGETKNGVTPLNSLDFYWHQLDL